MAEYRIPFIGVDTIILDTDDTRPITINRDPEPYETGVPVSTTISLEIMDPEHDGIDLSGTSVYIDGVLAFDGSAYDGSAESVFATGFNGSESAFITTSDSLIIAIDPELDFVSLNRTNIRVKTCTNGLHPGIIDLPYSFWIEDKTAPTIASAVAWGQKKVRVTFKQPMTQNDMTISGVTAIMPWGVESLVYNKSLGRYVLNDVSYPYVSSSIEAFALKHLDTIYISIDGKAAQTFRFLLSSFNDISSATANEVALFLNDAVPGASSWSKDGMVYLRSDNQAGSVQVVGGTANAELSFSDSLQIRTLPYGTVDGEYAIAAFAEYSNGAIGERRAFYELSRHDDSFVLEMVSEAMDGTTAANHNNYVMERVNDSMTPTVNVSIVSAEMTSSGVVELSIDIPMTPGSPYKLTASGVKDASGNVIVEPLNEALFTGWVPQTPSGRRFDLWKMVPEAVRNKDSTGDHRRIIGCMQEALNLVLHDIDTLYTTWSALDASDEFVQAMLYDLGNPFSWLEINADTSRKLVLNLVKIYKSKGTSPGIKAVLRLLMAVEADVIPFDDDSEVWVLGMSELGIGTTLGIDSVRYIRSFNIKVNTIGGAERNLTDAEKLTARKLINYMKAANEHFIDFIEPVQEDESTAWVLGVSELGGLTLDGVEEGETELADEEEGE